MRPVTVEITVPQGREQVFDYLDVLAHHESFTDHVLVDWRLSGPDRGIGAKAHVTVKAGGRSDEVDFEVIAADRPNTIVERATRASSRHRGSASA